MSLRTFVAVVAATTAALTVAGCHREGVVLTVRGDGLVADQLRFTATYDGHAVTRLRPYPAAASPLVFPQDLFADFGDRSVDVVFTVEALAAGRVVTATQLPSLHVAAGQMVHADAELSPPVAPPPPPPDLAPTRPSYASVVLADQPLAYYRLDEPAGATIAMDATGHGVNGLYGAQVTRGAPGLLAGDSNGAAQFNGGIWTSDGIVSVPRSGVLEPATALSIEFWLRPVANNLDFTAVVDYGDSLNVAHQPPYATIFYASSLATFLFTTVGGAGAPDFLTVTRPVPQRTYHYVQTYDGSNMKLYVNGVLEAQKPVSGALTGYGLTGLGIGGSPFADASSVVFAGTLDEIAIYGTALSPQRVLAHYLAGSKP
jgi:hypothetical protein